MKRLRLRRPVFLFVLAFGTLLTFSYLPLARIRAARVSATILPSAGKPLVNFKNPQSLKMTYTGSSDAVAALQAGTATPVSLAAADFNADGAIDVVAGYSTAHGGALALLRGNTDAYAPTNPALYPKAMQGSIASTFLTKSMAFTLPESPDLLVTGDFNRDGHQDVLAASQGGNLYLLAGDGTGNLLTAVEVPLAGQVRALAAGLDGHVAVSIDTPAGSELDILAPGAEGLSVQATYPLPARGDSVAWGNLGGGSDVAVGAGSNIAIVYNAISPKAQTETVTVPFSVQAIALGDYIWDQSARTEIAALADDGSIQILQHGMLNTAPRTAAQGSPRRGTFTAKNAKGNANRQSNPTSLGKWTVAKQLPGIVSAPSGTVSASAFNTPRLAATPTHDLMVLDAGNSQLNIFDTSGTAASPSAAVSFSAAPVAALALPQKIDAARDIVVLTSATSAPMLITSNATLTLNVNTTADIDSVNACATNSTVTSPPATLSLREAVCIANNNGAGTYTINVPAGTYDLAISTFGGYGSASSSGELQVGIMSGTDITISGAGQTSTIIQQTNGKDRLIEQDELVENNIPVTIQNLTLALGLCSDASGLDCADNGGGAILGGAPGDNMTITNVTLSDNESNPSNTDANAEDGGAITYAGGTLTITGSTFTGNKASAYGGGLSAYVGFFNSADVPSNFIITNSTFTNNIALFDNATDNIGNGGGIEFDLAGGYPASITGSTFTGNQVLTNNVNEPGGAIEAEGGSTDSFSMSTSRIVGNIAPGGGTGAYLIGVTPTLNNNWWGCNAGPNANGCDSILQDVSGSNVPYTPSTWLVLSISANPTQINPGATSTLTADLTHNNDGTGGFSVPNGTPVTFGGTLDSSVNPTGTTLTSGDATSTYTAGSSAGNGTGTATVDNQQVSSPIDILVSVTVTTSPGSLSIIVDGTVYIAPQTFGWVVGSTHTLNTISPQPGPGGSQYVWSSWSQGGAQSQQVTAPSSSTTYTATFTEEYQLTTQASPSADGSVTPQPGQFFASGASIPVTATANAGFQFNNWTSTGGTFDSTTSASTNFHMPAAATTVTGNFIPATVQITITTSPANLLVSVDGGPFTAAPLVETWNQGSSHTIASTSPQSGGTGIQYVFSSWSDGGAISHSITVPSTATTYTASFATQYQLTTAANPIAGGSVSPTSGNYYNTGTIVPLTATANASYNFTNWTGNVANSTSASTSITMTAPQSVTANFSLIIVAAPTTTSVSSNNNPSFTTAPGNSVTFTATVTSNTTVNEGTVTFSDTANDFTCSGGNTVPVSNGQASCTTSFTTEGSRVIAAAYNGTVNFQASGGFLTQTVNNHTVVTGNQFCNQGPITVSSTAGAATPYPSNIFVTGLSGNIGSVTVNLNNISASTSNMQDVDMLLVGPTGAAIVPFASVGDGTSIMGVNITLDDSASSLIPGGSPLTSGSYKPTSITGSTSLIFPSPAPTIGAANYAATDGAATLTSQFGGTAGNGTWALYVMDNSANDDIHFAGGWCVNITPAAVPITITTSPSGLLVSADGGTPTAAPLVENWVPGSSHTIATSSPQSGAPGVQYVFSSWSDSGAISHAITVPSTATTYTASFNTQYQLTTQASPPADGSVTPASGSYYASGATIPVTATANAGFAFSSWTSTGGSFDSTTSASTNFHMPAAPATVTGNFASSAVQITITTTPANLLVSADGGTPVAAPLVESWIPGSSHTITTTSPQTGAAGVQYVWSSWSDSGAISHSITVPGTATTYTAAFNTQYQLTMVASPSADGSVTPASGSYYVGGAIIPVTATANAGSQFTNWTSTGGSFVSTTSPSTNFTMPSSPATVTGNFTTASVQITIAASPANLLVSVDGGPATAAPLVETWIIGSSHTIATTSPQAGGTGIQYVWSYWSDSGAISHSITVPGTATTYTASFNTQYQLTTAANPSNGGAVSPPSGNFYNSGTVVPLTATPNAGFTFSSWTGNVANSSSASTTITVSSPQSVTANFTQNGPLVTLNPTSINFGTVYLLGIRTHNVTVKNVGTAPLTITNVSIKPGSGTNKDDFTFANLCPRTLAAGRSCDITVLFFAGNLGNLSATLNLTDNAPGSPQQVSMSATVDRKP